MNLSLRTLVGAAALTMAVSVAWATDGHDRAAEMDSSLIQQSRIIAQASDDEYCRVELRSRTFDLANGEEIRSSHNYVEDHSELLLPCRATRDDVEHYEEDRLATAANAVFTTSEYSFHVNGLLVRIKSSNTSNDGILTLSEWTYVYSDPTDGAVEMDHCGPVWGQIR